VSRNRLKNDQFTAVQTSENGKKRKFNIGEGDKKVHEKIVIITRQK